MSRTFVFLSVLVGVVGLGVVGCTEKKPSQPEGCDRAPRMDFLPTDTVITAGTSFKPANRITDCNFEVMVLDDISWTSSNEEVATVADDGVVTGVSSGTVRITATSAEFSTLGVFHITIAPPTVNRQGGR